MDNMDRRTWRIILCAGAILCITVGLRHSYGLFLVPISADLGIDRGTFSFSQGLMNLLWGVFAPIGGAIADRYGAARVAAIGGAFYAAGLVALALAATPAHLVTGGVLLGIGLGGAGFSVALGAAGQAVDAGRRTVALGIAAAGGSVGQFLSIPYATTLLDLFGWSYSLLVMAATAALVLILAIGLRRRTRTPATALLSTAPAQSIGAALREAVGHGSFRLLTVGFFVCGFQLSFVVVHLGAYLHDHDQPDWLAPAALAGIGFFNIFGTLAWGWIGARRSPKWMLSLIYAARALLFLPLFVFPVSPTLLLTISAMLGLLWLGTVPLTSGIVARVFGPAYLSMLFGIVFLGHQFGGFLGAALGGILYDRFGTYELVWWLNVVLGFAAALIHMPISERPLERSAVSAGTA